ncbi:MAG: hypothetical protein ACE5KJ_04345 [Candidatus Zixiibacteriota bacterium]
MKIKFVWLGIVLIIVGVFVIGCYTLLTHPRVQGEEEERIEHSGEYYREHCIDCHGDYHSYPYGYYYGFYPDYYWSYPSWGHYYAYPWWWERSWWYYDDDVEYVPISEKKAERRRGLEPPYVPEGRTPSPFISLPPSSKEEKRPLQIKGEEKPKAPKQQIKPEKPKQRKAKRRRR